MGKGIAWARARNRDLRRAAEVRKSRSPGMGAGEAWDAWERRQAVLKAAAQRKRGGKEGPPPRPSPVPREGDDDRR